MADIQSVFKPRRGKKTTMANSKKSTVLQSGEMFIEVDDSGVGKGHSRMKIGDGTSTYDKLPYAMGDTSNDKIEFTAVNDSTCDNCLNKVTSGSALGTLVAALKQAINCNKTSITKLNDDVNNFKNTTNNKWASYCTTSNCSTYRSNITTAMGKIKVYVGSDSKLHFVNSGGADTVLNFSSGYDKIYTGESKSIEDTSVAYSINGSGSFTKSGKASGVIDIQSNFVYKIDIVAIKIAKANTQFDTASASNRIIVTDSGGVEVANFANFNGTKTIDMIATKITNPGNLNWSGSFSIYGVKGTNKDSSVNCQCGIKKIILYCVA